jgi:hypothetical protein
MVFLPEFPPYFEKISVFLPIQVESGRDKSVKIRIIILARLPKEGIGLAVSSILRNGVPLYAEEQIPCIKNSADAPTTTESAPIFL